MTQSDIDVVTTSATCTSFVTGGSQTCYLHKVTVKVWAEYSSDAVANIMSDNLIGDSCKMTAPKGACTTSPALKTKAFYTTPANGGNFQVLRFDEGGGYVTIKIGTTTVAQSNGDPHIHRADGKKTDFRGQDGKIFNMLSARNFSLGVRTVESHFMQKFGAQKVHGTHFTEAFFTIRTNATGTLITARADALVTPWVDPISYVAISGQEKYPIKLSASGRPTFTMEDVNVTAVSGSKVVVRAASWEVSLTRRLLYKPLPESKTKNFLDISVRRVYKDPKALASHGVIGQSFDPKHRIAKDGKLDDYSKDEVTTTAQAEGAIEGVYTDYMVAAPYQTTFKYSLFDAPPEKATSAAMAAAFLSNEAFSETNEAASK